MAEDDELYLVVRNADGYYSVWPHERGLPLGWESSGHRGNLASCLEEIERRWSDPFLAGRRTLRN
jgi:MbtH protein